MLQVFISADLHSKVCANGVDAYSKHDPVATMTTTQFV